MSEAGAREERFPESSRMHGVPARLEAFGLRASIRDAGGVLIAEVDAGRAEIEVAWPLPEHAYAATTIVTGPFAAERRLSWADGSRSAVLRVFAAPDAPVVVVEWESSPADGEVVLRVRRLEGAEVIQGANTGGAHAAALLRAPQDRAARVVVHASGERAPDVDALIGAARARARRRDALRPELITGTDDPLAGAEHELRSTLMRDSTRAIRALRGCGEDEGRSAMDEAIIALALLALDERGLARSILESGGDVRGEALALVAGAWAAWTGDAAPLAAAWGRVGRWLGDVLDRADRGERGSASELSARALAPSAAELVGDAGIVTRLRAERLPAPAAALSELGRVTRADRERGNRASTAAAVVLGCVHGLLGVAPDAPRGRVRLAPVLGRERLRLARLAVGEARLSMDARLETGHALITVSQTQGPTPFSLVLEPWLPARRLRRASVDGVEGSVDAHPDGRGLRVGIQVVADHERRILLEFE